MAPGDRDGSTLRSGHAIEPQRTWSQDSSTFRKGTIGDWRNHFTEEHKAAFKEVAEAELIKLGYEKDYDW